MRSNFNRLPEFCDPDATVIAKEALVVTPVRRIDSAGRTVREVRTRKNSRPFQTRTFNRKTEAWAWVRRIEVRVERDCTFRVPQPKTRLLGGYRT